MAGDDADPSSEERPSWWIETERLREQMALPPYDPSRFTVDVYTYRVLERLEDEHDCVPRFVALDPRYPDDWEIRADGDRLFAIGRHRDEHGTTVYEMDPEAFERAVEEALVEALRQRVVRGAALDVFEEEPLPGDSSLRDLPNAIVTPHIAGSTPYKERWLAEPFATNYEAFLVGDADAMENRVG